MRNVKYFLVCMLVAGGLKVAAQTNPYIPTIIPPSPDAAALMKFADVPVSYYTGTADVSVPIYTIDVKGLSVPVSINYHTGGIRLKEEASNVGLGWALNSGGTISKTIMDKEDFTGTWFTSQVPEPQGDISGSQPQQGSSASQYLGPYIFDLFCNDLVNFSTGQANYEDALENPNSFDMEPDIYSYSFPGHMGKFIITRTGQVVMQKQDNIIIQFTSNGSSFTITDEKGNNFYFADKTNTQSAALDVGAVSGWNLSRIITSQQDTVSFTYTIPSAAVYTAPDYNNTYIYYSNNGSDGGSTVNGAGTYYGSDLLTSIDFSTGRLQFSYDANRSDLSGGNKLDSISLYSKTVSGLQYQRAFGFFYSYFNNSIVKGDTLETLRLRLDSVRETSGNLVIPPYAFTYNLPQVVGTVAKHSSNIDHWGFYNGHGNTGLIPNLTLWYSPPSGENPNAIVTYNQNNIRDPDGLSMTAFSLTQMTYPTGGKTVFQWEANDYDVARSQNGPNFFMNPTVVPVTTEVQSSVYGYDSGTINLSNIFPSLLSNSGQTNLTILVAFRAADTIAAKYFMSKASQASFSISGKQGTHTADMQNATRNGPVCSTTMQIPIDAGAPMTYTWSMYINPDVGDSLENVVATFVYDSVQLVGSPVGVNNNYSQTGGGLRIKTITDYKDNDSIAQMRRFEYNYNAPIDGQTGYYSYGILMSPPHYANYQLFYNSQLANFSYGLALAGSSLTSLTSAATDNIVGYSQVNEYKVNPLTGADIGKTVYTYYNVPDSGLDYEGFGFAGVRGLGNNLNGSLLSKTDYANVGGNYLVVDNTTYSYHTANRQIYWSPKLQFTGQSGDQSNGSGSCAVGSGVYEAIACFYPSLKSERVLMDSSMTMTYDGRYQGTALTGGKHYFYDNTVHYLPTRIRTYDSKGNMEVNFTRYPQDYLQNGSALTGNSILDSMIGRNLVSLPIEQGDSLYYPGSSSGSVTGSVLKMYRQLPNATIGEDKIYKLDLQSPATNFQPFAVNGNATSEDSRYEQKISFDKYDFKTNITQYTTEDQPPMSFIWDYDNTYPIAKVTNADSADAAYTSFEADGSGSWVVPSGSRDAGGITGSSSYNLSKGNVSRAGLSTATTYIVSYWSRSGGSYTVAGSTAVLQGKTINGWTYFEHTVTGVGTITVSGGADIDELRLYPKAAQMITYTYNPMVGLSSQCDVGNRVSYYYYDALGRLQYIKDQDGNIIKTYQYHYKGQTSN